MFDPCVKVVSSIVLKLPCMGNIMTSLRQAAILKKVRDSTGQKNGFLAITLVLLGVEIPMFEPL